MADQLTPAYRAVIGGATPILKLWGRLEVSGLEHLPETGPVILCANHDSYWDTVSIGAAARPKRQIHALAKSSLWGNPIVGKVLDGMGQIPIERGTGDVNAMQKAIDGLRAGIVIGIFPEGTRSLGRELRARSGVGRLAAAVPEAEIVCCSCVGSAAMSSFPHRTRVKVRFFRPAGGGLQPDESHADFAARIVREIRAEAPYVAAGRKRRGVAD